MHEYKVQEFNKQDADARSRTPDTPRDMNKNQVTQPKRLTQVTCYNCQQKWHVSRYCRNKKVSTPRVEDKPYNTDKPKYNTSNTQQKKTECANESEATVRKEYCKTNEVL